jgi:beta-lactamase class A
MKKLPNGTKTTLLVVGVFIVGAFVGHFVFPDLTILNAPELRSHGTSPYTYVNPLLECGEVESASVADVKSAEESIRTYIQIQKQAGTLTDTAVYYRDLNNGPWFGINQTQEFSPGSLLKVPLLMSIYKDAEDKPSILSEKIEYAGGGTGAAQDVAVGDPISSGHTYTINELIEHMITHSDNNAALLLYQFVGYEKTAKTYTELGINPPQVDKDYITTVRGYATFFRILFNATYLSAEQSEKALSLLAKAEFTGGLVAGVPSGTPVAHKFGERHYDTDGAIEQLHDCGIIYKPGHPYILCVMTRGRSVEELTPVIAKISSIIYQQVGN